MVETCLLVEENETITHKGPSSEQIKRSTDQEKSNSFTGSDRSKEKEDEETEDLRNSTSQNRKE